MELKYLGAMIDDTMIFSAHVSYISEKAPSESAALSRIIQNIVGPRQMKRSISMVQKPGCARNE